MNENDKKLLEQLGEETINAIGKLFCPDRSAIRAETEKNILALNDEDYGKAMKVLFVSETHFKDCMEKLRLISKKTSKNKSPIAPV